MTLSEYRHRGMNVAIALDPDPAPTDPRTFDGNVGVMLCAHRRYTLGDEQTDGDDFTIEVDCRTCAGTGRNPGRLELYRRDPWRLVGAGTPAAIEPEYQRTLNRSAREQLNPDRYLLEHAQCTTCQGRGVIELTLPDYLRRERGARVILPLGLLDHSGLAMYVGRGSHPSDPGGWDSGQVGVIFDTTLTRQAAGMQDATPQEIEAALREEVAIYSSYLAGEVYQYTVTDKDGRLIDTCAGFLGDLDHVNECARQAARAGANAARRGRKERREWACRGVLTT